MAQNDQSDRDPQVGNPSDFSEETNPNIELENLVDAQPGAPPASLEALTKGAKDAKNPSSTLKPFKPFGVTQAKPASTTTSAVKPATTIAAKPAATPVKPATAAPQSAPVKAPTTPSATKPTPAPMKSPFKPGGTGIGPKPVPSPERLAKEKAEAERLEAEKKAEEERLAKEREDEEREREEERRAEVERLENERRAEEALVEAERLAKEKEDEEREREEERRAEAERVENERRAREAEEALLASARGDDEEREREEERRAEAERRAEEERLESERKAREAEEARLSKERAEFELAAKQQAEREEIERKAQEEKERLEQSWLQEQSEEAERLARERRAKEIAEAEAERRAEEAAQAAKERAAADAKEKAAKEEAERRAKEERDRMEGSWQTEQENFKAEQQKLVRARNWSGMASLTNSALKESPWTRRPETRATLLLDLARLQRDRLQDAKAAEDAFKELLTVDPANSEAIDHLDKLFRSRGDWRSLHDMYANAVEPDWDPRHRLARTQEAAKIAREKLEDFELATTDWERLWRLGDATEEALNELNNAYRVSGSWARLAGFLQERAARLTGSARLLVLRELGEVCLTALRDQEKASAVYQEILANNPQDPVARLAWARILVRRHDYAALEAFAEPPRDTSDVPALDLARLAADALWQADEKVRSVMVYDRILMVLPSDEEALRAKEEFLAQNEQYEALCTFLVDRAEVEDNLGEKVTALERAAGYAEKELSDLPRAAQLLEQAAKLDPSRERIYDSLVSIYELLGDMEGVARALEGLLAITRAPQARVTLLRRLGDHYSQRLGNDEKAELYWREILSLVSQDDQVEDELLALHRRRGQFEALDAALQRQVWRTEDPSRAISKAREAAKNCQDAIDDPIRAREAWLRLLDIAPDDPEARKALTKHYIAHGSPRDAISATEAELRGSTDGELRRKGALTTAKRWESVDARLAGIASYEQALALDPTCDEALGALSRQRSGPEVGVVISALERASSVFTTPETKISALRQAQALLPEDAHSARFEFTRRTFWLSEEEPSEEFLAQLASSAEKAGLSAELTDVFSRLRWRSPSAEARLAYSQKIASLSQEKLENPTRAFLSLLSVGIDAGSLSSVIAPLITLAEKTERYEDLLAIWETLTRQELPAIERRKAISARAKICEERLKDPERAFWEWRRLLDIDTRDQMARVELERLAVEKGFWRQLDAVYGELWDRAQDDDERVEIAKTRQRLRGDHLKDPISALDALCAAFRVSPQMPGLRAELLAATEATNAWSRVLPLIEGVESAKSQPSAAELSRLANLYETHCKDLERAFSLYREAFAWEHESLELEGHLERLAEATNDYERLAEALRRAASLSSDRPRALALYHKVAVLYETKLASAARALEIHRRILRLDDTAIHSLEVVISAVRKQGDWSELRELLQQWLKIAPQDAPRVDKWLEIATIAREKLNDEEGALWALSQVLELEPQHPSAEVQLKELAQRPTDPSLELKRLKLELTRAQPPRRQEIFLRMAELQENSGDAEGAISTLRTLLDEAGVTSPGAIALERLYRNNKKTNELAALLEARGDAATEKAERLRLLEQAIIVSEERNSPPDLERLYKKFLAEKPSDEEALFKLAALLRSAGRYEDLNALIYEAAPALTADARHDLERERGRILRGLGKHDEARATFQKLLRESPEDATALFALASTMPPQELDSYAELRRRQAKSLPPQAAALVFCFLAELADETGANPLKISAFYREARQLDPDNEAAAEALKSLGRRAKGWRQTAALLPDPDEATLKPQERANRLAARGQKESSPKTAAQWFWRAVAVDPTHVGAWDNLAQIATRQNDASLAYCTRVFGLAAYECTTPLEPGRLQEHASRIFEVSVAARAANEESASKRFASLSYHIDPTFMAPVVTIADEAYDKGEISEAYALYDKALTKGKSLQERARLHAIYRRGILARRAGKRDRAVQDLRETLRVNPLHGEALAALAETLTEEGRAPAAVQHHFQALLMETDPKARGVRYFSIGKLLEDKIGAPDEAGLCYQMAQSAGIQERELTRRALRFFRRISDKTRALEAIDALLEDTQEVRELADLWTNRGELETNPDRAMEAFDMALSYEPGHKEALSGLAKILEEKGEWAQLLDIYEARLEGSRPQERAETLRQMAKISEESLKDKARAEGYLRQATELDPKREDLEHLLVLIGDAPERSLERRELTGRLVGFGPNWYAQAIDFAKLLLRDDERRWAWYLLSPMTQMAFPETSLKTTLQELRKEFEKKDNLAALTPSLRDTVRDSGECQEIAAILEELDGRLTGFGWQNPEEAGATGTSKLDERTAPGKLFRQLAQSIGVEDAVAWRVQDMPEPIAVLSTSPSQVLIRADLVQSLSSSDLAFVMAMGLDMAMPGRRLFLGASEEARASLIPAICTAVGLAARTSPLSAKISELIDDNTKISWAAKLAGALLSEQVSLTRRHHAALLNTSRRIGAVVAGDLRLASRAIARLYESESIKPQGLTKAAELDEHLAEAPILRSVLAFACSAGFNKFLL